MHMPRTRPPFPPPHHAQTADRGALYLQLLISTVFRSLRQHTGPSERSCSQYTSGASGTAREPQPPAKA
ncbi:hypothetical protein TRAPUB_7166 [Trametes pubescens]|uniref:Uncharacterized protein n=1 Tax=Trametes pubescens TaxID=154538 RepID=A0A1M2V3V9_TRAPU|nr:hypothetical protein TRAPUB_7166 [Trametes pubescens]